MNKKSGCLSTHEYLPCQICGYGTDRNLYWAAYSELSAIRHGRPMSDPAVVDQLLGQLEKAAKAIDVFSQEQAALMEVINAISDKRR